MLDLKQLDKIATPSQHILGWTTPYSVMCRSLLEREHIL
jgi:hypothetical protein